VWGSIEVKREKGEGRKGEGKKEKGESSTSLRA
jgi:hypothetical protein